MSTPGPTPPTARGRTPDRPYPVRAPLPSALAPVVPVLIVLTVLLAGCAGPSTRAAEPPSTAPATPVRYSPYVALGDSYTAAPLVPSPQGDDGCFRSTHNYPSLVAARLGADLIDRSCGGARTEDMTRSQQRGVPPQFDALTEDTQLVTLGIGGNDLDILGPLMAGCLMTGSGGSGEGSGRASCRAAFADGGEDRLLSAMPAVSDDVLAVLREIHRRAPRATVLVVGYPRIVEPGPGCARLPLTRGDLGYFAEVVRALDAAVRKAARRSGDPFVDIWSASRGHDVCAAVPWVNGIQTLPGKAAALHPFEAEQQAVADLIVDTLADAGPSPGSSVSPEDRS